MTNEGFKEYVNGNMLFWAANVKSSEGYRGKLTPRFSFISRLICSTPIRKSHLKPDG